MNTNKEGLNQTWVFINGIHFLFFLGFLSSVNAQHSDDQNNWILQNTQIIESLTSEDFTDLQFLEPLLEDKRIVQLGESAHGVSEYNQIKVRFIKYLHQDLGYNVIVFESGLFECHTANLQVHKLSALDLMKNCIFEVWWTEEVLPLFEYIKESHKTDNPLYLTGFDVQTNFSYKQKRAKLLREVVSPFNEKKAMEFYTEDTTMITGQIENEAKRYESIADYIEQHEKKIAAASDLDGKDVQFLAKSLRSEAVFQRQIALDFGPERTATRDKGMAENLKFILNELYPREKVITWGHNFHLRYKNSAVQPYPGVTMGEFMAEEWRDEMYTVGLYMGGGRAALNNRKPYEIVDIDTLENPHAETFFSSLNEPVVFLDLSAVEPNDDNRWIFQPTSALSWGRSSITFVPNEQYDALLFIREVSPPEYIDE